MDVGSMGSTHPTPWPRDARRTARRTTRRRRHHRAEECACGGWVAGHPPMALDHTNTASAMCCCVFGVHQGDNAGLDRIEENHARWPDHCRCQSAVRFPLPSFPSLSVCPPARPSRAHTHTHTHTQIHTRARAHTLKGQRDGSAPLALRMVVERLLPIRRLPTTRWMLALPNLLPDVSVCHAALALGPRSRTSRKKKCISSSRRRRWW